MLTELQLERRKKSIGSSDMAALLGISKWKSAWDIWAEKTGKLQDRSGDLNDAAMAGNRFERAVLAWAQEVHLGKLRRNVFMVAPGGLKLHANIDAVVSADGNPVECKTGGLFGPLRDEWGEPGTDQIPDFYLIQCQVEMLCAEREVCHVPVFLGGRGFQIYHVERNKDLIEIISEKARTFWDEFVLKDIPPPDSTPSFEVVARFKRTPGKRVRVSSESIVAWRSASEARKKAEEIEEQAKAKMLAELGDGDVSEPVELDGKLKELVYEETKREGIDTTALRDKFPEVAAQVKKTSVSRTAKLKNHKLEK